MQFQKELKKWKLKKKIKKSRNHSTFPSISLLRIRGAKEDMVVPKISRVKSTYRNALLLPSPSFAFHASSGTSDFRWLTFSFFCPSNPMSWWKHLLCDEIWVYNPIYILPSLLYGAMISSTPYNHFDIFKLPNWFLPNYGQRNLIRKKLHVSTQDSVCWIYDWVMQLFQEVDFLKAKIAKSPENLLRHLFLLTGNFLRIRCSLISIGKKKGDKGTWNVFVSVIGAYE